MKGYRVDIVTSFDHRWEAASDRVDGYPVEVWLVVWRSPETLKVPSHFLFLSGDEWLFSIADGSDVLGPVEIGRSNSLDAQALCRRSESDFVAV